MTTSRRFNCATMIALFTVLSASVAMADPPGRAVDIRYISGQVSIQPGGVNDWVAAVVNRPLTSADRVWTDEDSRAELHLGSSALRMNSETSMTLTNVNDQIVQVELDQGTLNIWVRHLFDGEIYEVDTPNLAFTVTKSGDYRFDVDPNGDTTIVTVRHGEGEATGQANAVKVRSGEQGTFSKGNSLQHEVSGLAHPDGFDDWCSVRDQREEHSMSARYVSPDVVGADDLDQYGTWRTEPGFGEVWIPGGVRVGWAPYHDGHWVWVAPWGWTWVDDAPWGYAPSHYGRWVFYGGAWGWSPGPVVIGIRPVYAPALVAWVGGAHWGVGVSFGGGGVGVGWFPLGYGEPYVPSYAVSRNYFRNVNVSNTRITNITTVTNNYYTNNSTTINNTAINRTNIHYANQTVPGAMTAVPASTMTNSQPVAEAAVRIPPSEAAKAPMAASALVAPARTSVLGSTAGGHAATPPSQAMSRQVVTKSAPPPKPVPFAAKQEALARNPGRPLDTQTEQQIRRQMPQQQTVQTTGKPSGAPGSSPNLKNGTNGNPNPNMGSAPSRNATTSSGRVVPRPPSTGGANGGMRPVGNNGAARPDVTNQNGAPGNGPQGRSVPRPPNTGGNSNAGVQPQSPKDSGGTSGTRANSTESIPRNSTGPGTRTSDTSNRSVPRPPKETVRPASPEHNAAHESVPRPAAAKKTERSPKEESKPKDKGK